MATFAMIENCSGFLWGVIEDDDPLDACRRLDESLGAASARYVERRIEGTSASGYHVHDVTGIMAADELLDGQDEATIARAASGRRVAQVVACEAEDD